MQSHIESICLTHNIGNKLKNTIEFIAYSAYLSLLKEVKLTPKPGLVDKNNSGSHRDMNYALFIKSAHAIKPYLRYFIYLGFHLHDKKPTDILPLIRPIGKECERAMFQVTNNINTHKGAIFIFSLCCTAIGRLLASHNIITIAAICREVAGISKDLVKKELSDIRLTRTAGEKAFRQYGITGIRGEVSSGFVTLRQYALPLFRHLKAQGYEENIILLQILLNLIANNRDTTIINRGGIGGLQKVRTMARELLNQGGILKGNGIDKLIEFDHKLIALNLSPGGSADLLALCYFLCVLLQLD